MAFLFLIYSPILLASETTSFVEILRNAGKVEVIISTRDDRLAARALLRHTHYQDSLHIMLAQRRNVAYICTKNVKDFRPCAIPVRIPDDL